MPYVASLVPGDFGPKAALSTTREHFLLTLCDSALETAAFDDA